MITLHSPQTLNKSAWDQMIHESVNCHLFGQSWLLDAAFSNWHALVLDDYVAGLVLPIKKKWGIPYAYNPLFIRECGVFSREIVKTNIVNQLIKAIPRSIISVDLFLNQTFHHCACKERVYQTLAMDQPIDTLRKNYNENTRRNIRKAEKQNMVIVYGALASEVTTQFLKNKLSEIQELKPSDEKILRQMLQVAIDRQQGFTVSAIKEDQILASAGFIHYKDTLLYFKGSVSPIGRQTGVMHLLMDQVLEKYAEKFTTIDFGGSNQPDVARFYKGLGGKDHVYYRYKKNRFM